MKTLAGLSQLFQGQFTRAFVLFVVVVAIFGSDYHRHVLITSGLVALMAIGFDILFGVAGQVALAPAAFMGISAYATALMIMNLGLPFSLAMLAAAMLSMLLAGLIAAPAVRVKGEYLLLLSLGFGFVVYEVLLNWIGLTGGPSGLSGIPSLGRLDLGLFQLNFARKGPYLALVAAAVALGMWASAKLRASAVGRALRAVRDDEHAAASVGVRVPGALALAFMVSALYASVAGSLFAHYIRILDPSSFTLLQSVEVLLISMLGGRDSTWGPVVGAILVVGLPEAFRPLAEYRLLVFGAAILAVILLLPSGIGFWIEKRPHPSMR